MEEKEKRGQEMHSCAFFGEMEPREVLSATEQGSDDEGRQVEKKKQNDKEKKKE